MRNWAPIALTAAVLAASACGAPQAPHSVPPGQAEPAQPKLVKRITAAIMSEPVGFNGLLPYNRGPGNDAMEDLLHAGMATVDGRSQLRPQLGETVPSIENDLWKLTPDGRMETTWVVKPNARWNDSAPFTAEDLAFTLTVALDRELPLRGHVAYRQIESIQAVDARTARVTWARPFIDASRLFTRTMAPPLPRHLLQETYAADKASLAEHPYWTERFVGAGPFTLREWVRGSHLVAAANDGYVLGRPKLDEVEVRFIRDPNALVANILAGAVELTLGRNLTLDPAIQVRDQWRDGSMEIAVKSWIVVYPQFINPNPAVVGDVRFRRALMHALDRQQMADSLQNGLVPVAHTMISPAEEIYAQVQDSVVRYEYDPRRAMQLVEEIGYSRGADGGYRDASGPRLGVEIRVLGGDDFPEKAMFSVADAWNRVGITTEPIVVPAQRERDAEYRSNFPGFSLHRQPNELSNLEDFRASQIPLPENNYLGRNRARYRNPEFEALIQRYFSTVPTGERTQVVRQIIHHMTDVVNVMGMIYSTEPTLIGSRLINVTARTGEQGSTHAWNAEQWDVR